MLDVFFVVLLSSSFVLLISVFVEFQNAKSRFKASSNRINNRLDLVDGILKKNRDDDERRDDDREQLFKNLSVLLIEVRDVKESFNKMEETVCSKDELRKILDVDVQTLLEMRRSHKEDRYKHMKEAFRRTPEEEIK